MIVRDARLGDVVAKARAKLAPKPQPAETPAEEPTPMQALWEQVKGWASVHGTDPQRLRYYLGSPALPESVTIAAIKAWLGYQPGNTLEALYELYVAGEGHQQAAGDTAAQQGALV